MATCRDVCTRAHKKLSTIEAGETLSAEAASDTMDALQGLFDRYVTAASTKLYDRTETAAYTAEENERIRIASALTITLPTTIEHEDRAPHDGALVEVVRSDLGTRTVSVYDANAGGWISVQGLDLDGTCPFADRDVNALAAALAEEISGEFGRAGRVNPREASRGRLLLSLIGGPDEPVHKPRPWPRRDYGTDWY